MLYMELSTVHKWHYLPKSCYRSNFTSSIFTILHKTVGWV